MDLLSTTTCLNCNKPIPAHEPLFEITHRFWCGECARPHMKGDGGLLASFGAGLRILIVMLLGGVAWLLAMFVLRVGILVATVMSAAIAVGAFKLMSIGSGDVDIDVRRIDPEERRRLGR